MDILPPEIIAYLCLFLPNPSLKSFRRCCKAFAEIGQKSLFYDFEFRLYPSFHRLYHFEQLGNNPNIASKLRCISFESGVPLEYADYRYWQNKVYNEISHSWSRSLGFKGASREAYQKFHEELQGRFKADMPQRYQIYRHHMDEEGALVAKPTIRDTLQRSIRAIGKHACNVRFKIVMAEPQISLEDLEQFDASKYACDYYNDPDPRHRIANRRKHCLEHFINFLDAVLSSGCRVNDLIAVNMPDQLLIDTRLDGIRVLEQVFSVLKTADIKLDYLPHSDWLSRGGWNETIVRGRNIAAMRFAQLLNHTQNLDHLRLEFPDGREAEYSYDLFDRTNSDRFPKLWLPHLKSLNLKKFRCRWPDLEAFLKSAKNLETLRLSNCRLESGSLLDLLYFVPDMRLQHVSIDGTWYVDEDYGEWHSHTAENFTDCYYATSFEGPYVHNGMRSKVEEFMLSGNECPLPTCTLPGGDTQIWEIYSDTSWHYISGPPRY